MWSLEEDEELRRLVGTSAPLGSIARQLGRPFASVACRIVELGLSRDPSPMEVRIPRGKGYDKKSVLGHLQSLEKSPVSLASYAKSLGLSADHLSNAIRKYAPERWEEYLEGRDDIDWKVCPNCGRKFIPASGKQVFCKRRCGDQSRRDDSYFGGNRAATFGLAESTCQLCGNRPPKGLSSHHVLGKENDPENEILVALCSGCHNLITQLGTRVFLGDEVAWESLISLAWLRKRGADYDGRSPVVRVSIELEEI